MAGAALAAFPGAARPASKRLFFSGTRRIGLQLYTLGDSPAQDLKGTFSRIAAVGYRDIELPGLYNSQATDIRAAADAAGLELTSLHLPVGPRVTPGSLLVSSDTQEIVDTLGALGIRQAVVPMMILPEGATAPSSEPFHVVLPRAMAAAGEEPWKRTAALLNERAAALRPAGISLGYHNHNVEFAPVGKTTGWDILVRETDPELVHFEADIGWIAAAGLDPTNFLTRHRGRVRQLHVKDVTNSSKTNFTLNMDSIEIGAGCLDWQRILPAAEAAGVRHYYVEQEPPFTRPRLDAVARSFAYLAQLRA